MKPIRSSGFRSGALACALVGVLFAFGSWGSAAAAEGELSPEAREVHSWFDKMAAHFDANPELKTTPGSGWKPYNRIRHFTEQRMLDGELPPAGARWAAWERKRDLERTQVGLRNTWFSLGPTNFAGRMLALDFDPNNASIVYVGGADGGVWKSTNGGNTWMPMSDELPSLAIGGLAVSKTNPNIVVIGTGEATNNVDRVGGVGILRSTDAGTTWEQTSLTFSTAGSHGFHFVECGPSGVFLAGATDSLYRSDDDGATWTAIRPGEYSDALWSPLDPNKVFSVRVNATPGASVKVSTDDGITWTKAGSGQPASYLFSKSKLGISGTTIYCFIGDGNEGVNGLFKSTDDGANWFDTNAVGLPAGQTWYNLICCADPNNADRVIVGAVGLARSGNGGATFNNILSGIHVDQHVIKYEPGSSINVWVGNDGGMYRSNNDGGLGSWVGRNSGLVTYQFYDICVNNGPLPYYILGGTQDNGTDKWSGTTTWANALGADGMVCNVGRVGGTTVYAEIQFGDHRRSNNSGSGFFSINGGLTGEGQWVTPVALDPNNDNRLFTETSAGLFRSTNGTSWSQVSTSHATWIDISPVNSQIAWTALGSQVRLTTDGGTNWNLASPFGFLTGGATKILAHPTDVNTALVTFSSYGNLAHVALTTDLGATWTDVTGDFPSQPVNAIAVDPSNPTDWYIGTDVGVWYSGSGGAHWMPYETGLPNAVVVDLEIADAQRKLVAGTHGRGAWEVAIPPAGVVSAELNVQPEARNLMLDEPWPNPATDRTLLRYAAKSEQAVTLSIYDVQGRLVSSLEDFSRGDGVIRTTPWFTDDVSSGVYFAVLRAGTVQLSRKITVLK